MRRTKNQKMIDGLGVSFRLLLTKAMQDRFGIETETSFSIAAMGLSTMRTDGKPFTPVQMQFLAGFSEGYAAATNMIARGHE